MHRQGVLAEMVQAWVQATRYTDPLLSALKSRTDPLHSTVKCTALHGLYKYKSITGKVGYIKYTIAEFESFC